MNNSNMYRGVNKNLQKRKKENTNKTNISKEKIELGNQNLISRNYKDFKERREIDDSTKKFKERRGELKKKNSIHIKAITDEKLLDMIREAITDEKTDIIYYSKLIDMAKTQEEKDILNDIKMDEQKHEKIYEKIYYMLTGQKANISPKEKKVSENRIENYKNSILEELEGAEFYKNIYLSLDNQMLRDMVFETMVDEEIHSVKNTYLASFFK